MDTYIPCAVLAAESIGEQQSEGYEWLWGISVSGVAPGREFIVKWKELIQKDKKTQQQLKSGYPFWTLSVNEILSFVQNYAETNDSEGKQRWRE